MNAKHLQYVAAISTAAAVADQVAQTGFLQSLGPWGGVAALFLSTASYAYLHRQGAPAPANG